MRKILFDKDSYRGEIRTSDLICPAYGNNYIDIAFTQESQAIPDNVTIEIEGTTNSFTLPLRFSRLAPEQLDGCFFSLAWFRYYAPSHGIKSIELSVYADDVLVASVEYQLTAGRGEVEFGTPVDGYELGFIDDEVHFVSDIVVWAPTQCTKHWHEFEFLVFNCESRNGFLWLGDLNNAGADGTLEDNGFHIVHTSPQYGETFSFKNQGNEFVTFAKIPTPDGTCADIEIRITNRHGLRGAMGGKIIDASEGGDDVKSNFATITPYQGIHRHEKIGQKIQKEVFFDCGGDADLLSLLRDACVYGVVEWYDERTSQWLPCQVVDNSLDTDPFKEQSITLILQQL